MDWIARKRDWRQFFRFERKLARITGGAYNSALLLNPEIAEANKGKPKPKHPQLFRFTNEMHLLTDIGDILYKQAVKDPRSVSLPRPLTAADHLSRAKRQAGMNRVVAQFSPQHVHLTPRID
ncbi:hypothetical protein [Nocardia sp. NPDC004260]